MSTPSTDTPDLGDYLAAEYDDPPPIDTPEREAWSIGDDRQASWAFRKLASYEAELARLQGLASEERERIDQWLADSSSGTRSQAEFFEGHLVGYLHRLLDSNPQLAKTYKLPGGKLQRRKGPDKVRLIEGSEGAEAEFVAWALANERHELLTLKPSVSAAKASLCPLGTISAEEGTLAVPSVEVDKKGAPVQDEYGNAHPILTVEGELVPGLEYVVGSENLSAKAEEGQA